MPTDPLALGGGGGEGGGEGGGDGHGVSELNVLYVETNLNW